MSSRVAALVLLVMATMIQPHEDAPAGLLGSDAHLAIAAARAVLMDQPDSYVSLSRGAGWTRGGRDDLIAGGVMNAMDETVTAVCRLREGPSRSRHGADRRERRRDPGRCDGPHRCSSPQHGHTDRHDAARCERLMEQAMNDGQTPLTPPARTPHRGRHAAAWCKRLVTVSTIFTPLLSPATTATPRSSRRCSANASWSRTMGPRRCCRLLKGHTEVVAKLFAANANVDQTNNNGATPLHRPS